MESDSYRPLVALITLLLGQTFCARNILASIFVMLWAVRLACVYSRSLSFFTHFDNENSILTIPSIATGK